MQAGIRYCAVCGHQGQTFLGDAPFKWSGLLKMRKKFGKRMAIQPPAGKIFTAGKFAAFKQQDRKSCRAQRKAQAVPAIPAPVIIISKSSAILRARYPERISKHDVI